ncbi:hypothetical protein BO70DRAFT_380356 [Aspergillus heteromorphus CBS 117.55]|uniref:Uncharacterized protein n=1 Tax=Aspergillus heteromorphus CBS 117.55 TaxID=1448321 RepID=A0A317VZV4_9EURO|nr:uncharacterized protein BO70DRAFT_380356 [Aspergillus heteromorphus CBS 117.55]PWY79179.1 hypothetical protein BO70DRAFT_380356 [Aspergillus heteromorphus CBS 117.55]
MAGKASKSTKKRSQTNKDDLDVIESGLPGQFVEIYLSVLVYAWLMKDIIGRFFTNPFWYVDIQPDSENINMDEVRRGTTAFGADLYAFWKTVQPGPDKSCLPENKRYSQPWRMWAVRLCNPSDPTWMGSDWGGKDFGDKEVAHRKAMTSAMCDHVLAGEFLQSMLKPLEGPEPIAQRRQSLDHVYQLAADMSFRSWSHVQHLEFGTLNNLNNRFSSEDANLAMAYRYNLFTRRKRFEGHRILSVMKPAIYICGGMNDPSGRELLMPAEVVIDVDPDR